MEIQQRTDIKSTFDVVQQLSMLFCQNKHPKMTDRNQYVSGKNGKDI